MESRIRVCLASLDDPGLVCDGCGRRQPLDRAHVLTALGTPSDLLATHADCKTPDS